MPVGEADGDPVRRLDTRVDAGLLVGAVEGVSVGPELVLTMMIQLCLTLS